MDTEFEKWINEHIAKLQIDTLNVSDPFYMGYYRGYIEALEDVWTTMTKKPVCRARTTLERREGR